MAILKSEKYVYFLAFVASLGSCTSGLFFTIFNAAHIELEMAFSDKIPPGIEALIQSFIPLGGLVGGILSGPIANNFGRRIGLITADVLTIIGCILTIASSTPIISLFLLGRFICGLTVGFNWTIVTLFIRETSPVTLSGRTGSFFKLSFAFGILASYLISLMLPADHRKGELWRLLFFFPAVIAILRASIFIFFIKFDTPKFYMLQNNTIAAQKVLTKIYKEEFIASIYEKEKKASRLTDIREYFKGKFKKQFRLACMLIIIFQLTGINLITFYSSKMFFNSSTETDETNKVKVFNLMIGMIRVICAVFAGYLADRVGRRMLFVIGISCITVILFLLGLLGQLGQHTGVKVFLLLYVIANGFTFATILPVYMAEILPLNGCGFAVSFENLTVFLVIYTFPFLVNLIGLYSVFYMCFSAGIAGLVYIWLRVKETKGKKDIEIYNEFNVEGADYGLLDEDMIETLNSQGLSMVERKEEDLIMQAIN